MDTFKTSAQDCKVFARFVRKWIKKMRLGSWSIYIQHKNDDEDPDGDVAWIQADHETLVCTIALSVDWPIPSTKELLELAAYHECLHLLLIPLMDHVKDSKISRQEEHRLIVALERMQFGKALSEHGVTDGKSED
jgi:hypothetical protein